MKKKVSKAKAKKASAKKKSVAKKPAKKAAAKKATPKKASAKREKLKVINVKLSKKVREALAAKAKQFTKGNLSLWLRHTGLKYVPAKGEVIAEL